MLPDVPAHGRIFIWMLPLPPFHVMQVAAESERSAFNRRNGYSVFDRSAALMAQAGLNKLRCNHSVPGNAPVPQVVKSGDIEMLQDLVTAAVNEAARKIDESMQSAMGGMLGGMGIPGL